MVNLALAVCIADPVMAQEPAKLVDLKAAPAPTLEQGVEKSAGLL